MARHREAQTEAQGPLTPIPDVTNSSYGNSQGRGIVLPSGERRVDYIKRRWKDGTPRGQIAKELSEIEGRSVPYQVVYQSTKPPKVEVEADDISEAGGPNVEAAD